MRSYDVFAPFYDEVMGDRTRGAAFAHSLIQRHHPGARTILELACGTGAILEQLRSTYEVAGLDASKAMLEVAARRLPGVRLFHEDMRRFTLRESFDVILCLFDSMNHLLRFREWEAVFDRAHRHLGERGILIFDVNTERMLAALAEEPAYTAWFRGESLLHVDVVASGSGVYTWKVRVFDRRRELEYRLQAEDIPEVAFSADRIKTSLARRFRAVRVYDPERTRPTTRSLRLYFVGRR